MDDFCCCGSGDFFTVWGGLTLGVYSRYGCGVAVFAGVSVFDCNTHLTAPSGSSFLMLVALLILPVCGDEVTFAAPLRVGVNSLTMTSSSFTLLCVALMRFRTFCLTSSFSSSLRLLDSDTTPCPDLCAVTTLGLVCGECPTIDGVTFARKASASRSRSSRSRSSAADSPPCDMTTNAAIITVDPPVLLHRLLYAKFANHFRLFFRPRSDFIRL